MNLTDLQVELRSIEERIEVLHNEIEKMKPQTEEEKKTDFQKITKLAEKYPLVRNNILNASIETKKLIFSSLSYILLLEENDFYNRLLYLCRLSKGCGFESSAEELYKIGLEFEMNDLYQLAVDITEYKYSYLVEAFILANISAEASVNILSIIADLALAFGINNEEIKVLAMVAKSTLTNNLDYLFKIPMPSKNMLSGKFKDYISEDWLIKNRKSCGSFCTKKYLKMYNSFLRQSKLREKNPYKIQTCKIENGIKTSSIVKQGDDICTYEQCNSKIQVKAPCDGVVYVIKDKKQGEVKDKMDEYVEIYVVSYFDDYEQFCKWYRLKDNGKEV